MITPEELVAAPKVLLHDHLDGGLRPGTVVELAREIGHALPRNDAAELGAWFVESADSGSLERYLETFDHTVAVMQTVEAIKRVASECVRDLAADGVVYAEIRYAPEQHLHRGLTLEQVVDAVREGFEHGMATAERPIVVRQLLTAMRHMARSMEIAELAVAYRDAGVVGFDIAGAEAGYPPTRHLDAFEYLQRENAHFTIHAGEGFGLPSIWQAIQWCGADRLGHGVRIIDDISHDGDKAELGRLAAYVRDRRIPLEMCPSSNLQTGAGRVDRRASDRPAHRAPLPGHGEHRQPIDERHVDEPRARPARGGVRLRPRRSALVRDQRDEVGLPPVRRKTCDHQQHHQTLVRLTLTQGNEKSKKSGCAGVWYDSH
ncbi:adenosine deaminase [Kribbella aluminosa]|uniref:adenosine deaminase n=1 Tax=Kribbella aluminosa TaxID=416017 RepID=A0ABS4UQY5_9ACTN|nr:adenosine deaminase [Kribbella aluminosa]